MHPKYPLLAWKPLFLLLIIALCIQGCAQSENNRQVFATNFTTGPLGQSVSADLAAFTGTIYLTVNGNLFALNGTKHTFRELTHTKNAIDPAISPDDRWIAFIEKYQNYSDLCMISSAGGPVHVLRSGNGAFYNADGPIHNTYTWYAQPSWSADGTRLLFLSDLEKEDWYQQTGQDAPLLDLQVFSISLSAPTATPTDVAYATYGDGGDQNPSYRPGHPDQIVYTHYSYDSATQTQQVIQLYMENPDAISERPGTYYPGSPGGGYDPAIAITPTSNIVSDPAFSPNGNALAYIKTQNGGNQMELDVMTVPPATITQTPNDPATEQTALHAYETTSSHLQTNLELAQPVWSPNGNQIAYYSSTNDSLDLWVADIGHDAKTNTYKLQGNPKQITFGGVDAASHATWTR